VGVPRPPRRHPAAGFGCGQRANDCSPFGSFPESSFSSTPRPPRSALLALSLSSAVPARRDQVVPPLCSPMLLAWSTRRSRARSLRSACNVLKTCPGASDLGQPARARGHSTICSACSFRALRCNFHHPSRRLRRGGRFWAPGQPWQLLSLYQALPLPASSLARPALRTASLLLGQLVRTS
jgi:hypothetical protein